MASVYIKLEHQSCASVYIELVLEHPSCEGKVTFDTIWYFDTKSSDEELKKEIKRQFEVDADADNLDSFNIVNVILDDVPTIFNQKIHRLTINTLI